MAGASRGAGKTVPVHQISMEALRVCPRGGKMQGALHTRPWKPTWGAHLQGCARASPPPRPSLAPRRAGRGPAAAATAPGAPASLGGPPFAPEPGSRREACGGDFSRDAETRESAGPDPGPGRQRASGLRGRRGYRSRRRGPHGLRRRSPSAASGPGTSGARRAGLRAAAAGGRAGPGAGRCSRTPCPRAVEVEPPPLESPTPTCTASRPGSRELPCRLRTPLLLPAFQKLPRRALPRLPLLNPAL